MKKETKTEIAEPAKRVKLKLNYNTFVTVRTDAALQMWMKKYPDAKIVET
jgi:hypothetical protein